MAKYKKGEGGRPKGVTNKTTRQAKESFLIIMDLLEKRMTEREDVIGKLSPARAAELYTNLLNYIKPKLSMVKNENTNDNTGQIEIIVKYEDNKKPNQLT